MFHRLKVKNIRYKNYDNKNKKFYNILECIDLDKEELLILKGHSIEEIFKEEVVYIRGVKHQKEYNGEIYIELIPNKEHLIGKSYQSTIEGLVKFLTTLPGIGEKTAQKICEIYIGDNISDIKQEIINDIKKGTNEKLNKILKENKRQKIIEYFKEQNRIISSLKEFQTEFNIPNHVINKIEKKGLNVIETFLKNPYEISFHIKGIGFKTVDKIALTIQKRLQNNDNFDFLRLKAAVFYSLEEASKEGHVYLGIEGIKYYLKEKLNIKIDNIPKYFLEKYTGIKIVDKNIFNDIFENNISVSFCEEDLKQYFKEKLGIDINIDNIKKSLKINFIEEQVFIDKPILNEIKKEYEKSINNAYSILIDKILEELQEKEFIKLLELKYKNKTYKVAYLIENYKMEIEIAKEVKERLSNNDNVININKIYTDNFIQLSEKQEEAIHGSLKNNLFIVTGGPGTGKTTVAKYIFKNLKYYFPDKKIAVMAPTGTAAKRIGNVIETEATTIHIGLKWKRGQFLYNEFNKHPADIIMIDEASMIDMPLFYSLLKAMKKDTKLILIGDIDQLPPVGTGKILEDLLKSEVVPYTKLDRIYRQAEDNPIADFAYDVNNGIVNFFTYSSKEYRKNKKMNIVIKKSFNKKENSAYQLNMENEVVDIFYEIYKKQKMDIMDIQLLAQMKVNKGGVNSINKRIQELINENSFIPGTSFKIGDKVLQVRNNYIKEVMNGNIGKIIGYDGDNTITVEFIEGTINKLVEYKIKSSDTNETIKGNLELGYCMTVHKSQGNEWKKVIILFNNYFFINRKIIYTGITRAKEQTIIVTNYPILTHGIKTEFGIKEINGKLVKIIRNTNLKNFLKNI